MGMFGDFNNKKNKKVSRGEQAKKAAKVSQSFGGYVFSPPEVVARGKNKNSF